MDKYVQGKLSLGLLFIIEGIKISISLRVWVSFFPQIADCTACLIANDFISPNGFFPYASVDLIILNCLSLDDTVRLIACSLILCQN